MITIQQNHKQSTHSDAAMIHENNIMSYVQKGVEYPEIGRVAAKSASSIKIPWVAWLGLLLLSSVGC